MRIARTCALLAVLVFAISSLASASSYGPTAPKGPASNTPSTSHNVNFPYYGFLYLNPYTGSSYVDVDAWTINYGYAVSNSFELGGNSALTQAALLTWLYPGDVATGFGYQIGTCPGCNNIGSGFSATSVQYDELYNKYGYLIAADYFPISTYAPTVGAGTYYLTLDGATDLYGAPVYWDQVAGPTGGAHSTAFENAVGWLGAGCGINWPGYKGGTCSETFGVVGYGSGQAPEPGSLMLLGSGLLGLGGVIRRRFGK